MTLGVVFMTVLVKQRLSSVEISSTFNKLKANKDGIAQSGPKLFHFHCLFNVQLAFKYYFQNLLNFVVPSVRHQMSG